MNKIKIGIILAALIFLFMSLGYCQELTDWERGMYYESASQVLQFEHQLLLDTSGEGAEKAAAKMQQFMDKNGLTLTQFYDIIDRGNKMSFTATEEQVSKELKTRITDNLSADETMAVWNDLASKYGMSVGQVSSVLTRNSARN